MKQQHVDYQVVPNPKIRRWFAARFTGRLKDLIESGYGLPASTVELEQTVALGASKKS